MVGRCLEVVVAKTSASALDKDSLLVRLNKLEEDFAGFSVLCNCSERHVKIHVLSVLSLHELSATCATMLCHDVLAILQMDKGPELRIRSKNDMASTTSVTSVRSSLRNIFLPPHMSGTCTTVTGTAIHLYIIYKI